MSHPVPFRALALAVGSVALIATVVGSAPAPPSADAGKPIVIGHREKAGKSGSRDFQPALDHLNSRSAGRRYEFRAFDSADELLESLKTGSVDAALLGPVYYVRAHHEFGAFPIVAEGSSYRSVLFVKDASPIRKVEDIRGKRFAMGYRDSTSSHYFPLLMLSKARIKEADLAAADFVGGHSKVIEAVLSGKYDAGGVIENEFDRAKGKGLRLVAASDPIPGVPVVVRKELDPRVVGELRTLLLSFKAPSPDPGIAFSSGLVETSDRAYNQIRFLCKVLFDKDYK